MAALATPTPQHAAVAEALATVTPPKGLQLLSFALDTDWSGDPAVHIVYGVSKRVPLTKARVGELLALKDDVWEVIRNLDIGRLPYVKFDRIR